MNPSDRPVARIGLDLGTTNTVVALADRGNFPVLGLEPEARSSVPSVIAWDDGHIFIGQQAQESLARSTSRALPSFKRWLGHLEPEADSLRDDLDPSSTAASKIEELLVAFLAGIRERVVRAAGFDEEIRIEAMLGVPANANSLQRWRTVSAARTAGFDVLGLVHEPTAAALEHAHRHPLFGRGKAKRHVLVYDLGGGTFDASLVRIDPEGVTVVRSTGIERLGGDDFDRAMADLVLEGSGAKFDQLPAGSQWDLLLRCREAKEAIRPTTKKWIVDLSGIADGEVSVRASDYADRCAPMVKETVRVLQAALDESGLPESEIDALLLVGGGSELPMVRKRLSDLFATRVRISPHPFASTAIGLAIHADRSNRGAFVSELLSRNFGVWREAESGKRKTFDVLFDRSTPLPAAGDELIVTRRYRPAHDVGVFSFEECLELDSDGLPSAGRTPWCEILFPFDPARSVDRTPASLEVEPHSFPPEVVATETWSCDPEGMITVRIERSVPPLASTFLLYGPERIEAPASRRKPAVTTT